MRRSTKPKTMGGLTLLVGVLVGGASHVSAATIIGLRDGNPTTARKAPYTVSLTPTPAEHLDGPTDDDLKLLRDREAARRGRGRWTFEKGAAAPGTFEILQYAAFITDATGGADFVVLYDDGVAAARTDYSWLQIGRAEDWGSFDNKTFVDSLFPNFPFYSDYTPISLPTALTPSSPINPGSIFKDATNYPQQKIQNPAGGGKIKAGDLMYSDEPFCPLTCADRDGHAQLILDMFLVEFVWNNRDRNNAGGTVMIRDGMRWGVQITCDDDPEGDDTPCNVPEPPRVLLMLFALVALAVGACRSTALAPRYLSEAPAMKGEPTADRVPSARVNLTTACRLSGFSRSDGSGSLTYRKIAQTALRSPAGRYHGASWYHCP